MIKVKEEKVLITPEMIEPRQGFEIIGTFNPGAVRLKNKDIMLYVRVAEIPIKKETKKNYLVPRCIGKEKCKIIFDKFNKEDAENDYDRSIIFKNNTKRLFFLSHLRRVVLDKTGFKIKSIDKLPSFEGLSHDGELGVEDPRITKINKEYYMTYVTLSKQGNISTSLAESKDGVNWKRRGIIFKTQDKDCVLFAQKIKEKYFAFNRPEGNFEFSPPRIWISSSKDLQFWGNPTPIKLSKNKEWDSSKVGAGPPPIKTKKGWLLIYHGIITKKKYNNFFGKLFNLTKEEKNIYVVGAALFDLKEPWKLIAKSPKPILIPRKKYERFGDIDNVIFPTGLIEDIDKKNLLIFSGAADKVVTVKKVLLNDIMKCLKRV